MKILKLMAMLLCGVLPFVTSCSNDDDEPNVDNGINATLSYKIKKINFDGDNVFFYYDDNEVV